MNCRLLFALGFAGFFGLSARAQTERGARFNTATGSFQYGLSKSPTSGGNRSSHSFNVGFGWQRGRFVRDDVAHGWLVNLSSRWDRSDAKGGLTVGTPSRSSAPTFQAGYFIRRYLRISDPIRFFAQGSLLGEYAALRERSGDGPTATTTRRGSVSLQAQPSVGAVYFLKNGWALEAQTTLATASLTHSWFDQGSPQTNFSADGSLGMSFFRVGLSRYFGGNALSPSPTPSEPESIYRVGQRYRAGGFKTGIAFNLPGRGGNVSLTTARFVKTNRARGAELSLGYSNYRGYFGPNYVSRTNAFSVGIRPFREYYWPLAGKWSVFLNAGLSIAYTGNATRLESEPAYLPPPVRHSYRSVAQLALTVFPGIQYQFAQKWALAATVGWLSLGNVNLDWTRQQTQPRPSDYVEGALYVGTPFFNPNNLGLSLRYFPQRRQQPG